LTDIVVTLIGPDRPGLVEAVAAVVAAHGGSWQEGRMAQLAGKFAGILRIEVAADGAAELTSALAGLEKNGLRLICEIAGTPSAAPAGPLRTMDVELLGLDRPGLVREVSSVLAARRVNVESLETDVYSAPMTADSMFRARARVRVPGDVDAAELRASLERLAGDLMVDIRVGDTEK
jgi:glycine cleavage system regulatory protein